MPLPLFNYSQIQESFVIFQCLYIIAVKVSLAFPLFLSFFWGGGGLIKISGALQPCWGLISRGTSPSAILIVILLFCISPQLCECLPRPVFSTPGHFQEGSGHKSSCFTSIWIFSTDLRLVFSPATFCAQLWLMLIAQTAVVGGELRLTGAAPVPSNHSCFFV